MSRPQFLFNRDSRSVVMQAMSFMGILNLQKKLTKGMISLVSVLAKIGAYEYQFFSNRTMWHLPKLSDESQKSQCWACVVHKV